MAARKGPRIRPTWLWPALSGAVVVALAAAAASAAIETKTVHSYWRGLWWSISLMATVGFVGEPPETTAGRVLSAVLMVFGFLLLAIVSASLAALLVREEEEPREVREETTEAAVLTALDEVQHRLEEIDAKLDGQPETGPVGADGGDREPAATGSSDSASGL